MFTNLLYRLYPLMTALVDAGGIPYIVGGAVRDGFISSTLDIKDVDIEVFNMTPEQLAKTLSDFSTSPIEEVGKSFGVYKITYSDYDIDVSIPRKEKKQGIGHKGFDVTLVPTLSVKEAAARRDFTINAIYLSRYGEIIDPYGGVKDIENKLLKPTSEAFEEDCIRPMRAFQFASRFAFQPSADLTSRSASMYPEASSLPVERFWGEWEKWALKSVKPSEGLNFLVMSEWVGLYPEIGALLGCEQSPEVHPEGSVYVHTLLVTDAAAKIAYREQLTDEDRLTLLFAALCHDFGKPETTVVRPGTGRIASPGHGPAGVEPTEKFLTSIGASRNLIEKVKALVLHHLDHIDFKGSERAVRRLSLALSNAGTNLRMLSMVAEADHSGRPPLAGGMPEPMVQMLEIAERLAVVNSKPIPILMGRHLIELGMKPGPAMGRLIDKVFDAQLEGEVTSLQEGLELARKLLSNHTAE